MTEGRALGDFLRSRRDALRPTDVGLPEQEHRRVPGLRRDEVALLSGVSVDYVKRIEQGHERSPSVQVLDALARALRVDSHGLAYMARLTGQREPAVAPDERVRPAVHDLIGALTVVPALVIDPGMSILATNALADALFRGFERADNLLRMIFLDPHATTFYGDWDLAASGAVRNLRANVAEYPDHPAIAEVLSSLAVRSPAFAGLWARHEVRPRTVDDKLFRHPDVGDLDLRFQTFSVDESPGQRLYLYAPARGSDTGARLAMLAELTDPTCVPPTRSHRHD